MAVEYSTSKHLFAPSDDSSEAPMMKIEELCAEASALVVASDRPGAGRRYGIDRYVRSELHVLSNCAITKLAPRS